MSMIREKRMKNLKKLFVLVLALALIGLVAPSASQAATKSSIYDGYYFYAGTVKVTDSKGNLINIGDSVKNGTQLTVTVTLKPGYEWDTSEESSFYVQGNSYTLDKNHSFKFKTNASDYGYFYIDTDYAYYNTLPHYEYEHDYGYTVTVKDSKGNVIKEGDLLTDGAEYTATVTLKDGYEWLADEKVVYAAGNEYTLDKKNSFKFKYDEDDSTVVSIVLADTWYSLARYYTASITSDSHVKSFTFVNATNKKKATVAAGEKEYLFNRANGLYGTSGNTYQFISFKCELESGYELDTVTVNKGSIEAGSTSDTKLITYSTGYNGDIVANDKLSINITTKKAGSGSITLDKKKYKVVAPTVSGGKFKKSGDYYTATQTFTFSKAKNATVIAFSLEKYGKKGDTYGWIDSEKTNMGTDLTDCEIIDLTGVKGLTSNTAREIVSYIYSAYKSGYLPALKAVFLPSNVSIELKNSWYNYNGLYEYSYYPIQVITAE